MEIQDNEEALFTSFIYAISVGSKTAQNILFHFISYFFYYGFLILGILFLN